MSTLNEINNKNKEMIQGLKAKQIRLILLNLWKKYYNALLINLNKEKADNYLENIDFVMENSNTEEWYKVNKNELISNIDFMANEIAIDLRFDTIKLSTSLNNMVIFSIYQKLNTFNKMFNIIKDSLNTLNDNQSIDLASEIVMCKLLIKRVKNNEDIIYSIKLTDDKEYNRYLKEEKRFINSINSTIFPDDININIESIRIKINDKLKRTENINCSQ